MNPSSTDAAPSADRQPRVRRLTGLIAGGVAIVAVAVAIPALAATTDPQAAGSSETTVTSAALAASVAVTPPTSTSTSTSTSTTVPAPPAPTAEELLAAQLATYTPEQKLAFDLYIASPEARAAWAAFIAPPPPPPPPPAPEPAAPRVASGGGTPPNAFLACVRQRESGGNYSISSGDGLYRGAYQFHRTTWNNTASNAGRGDLVGADPASVSPSDQDAMAAHLYQWQGRSPWAGNGC